MEWVSAPNIEDAALPPGRSGGLRAAAARARDHLEAFLEAERGQLPLWAVVAFAAGIAIWLILAEPLQWLGFLCVAAGAAALGLLSLNGRAGQALFWLGFGLACGCGWIWLRSETVAAPRLERPRIAEFAATVEKVETLAARGDLRLTLAASDAALPPRVRVSLPQDGAPAGLAPGAAVQVRARLTPPPPMALPGSHDFARDAWFRGIGGVGRALGPVEVLEPAVPTGLDAFRSRLDRHIRDQLPGSSGTIATALATGDQNSVSEEDAEAMRRSGLAHLLSVSGLHIAAVVGAAMLLTLKLLALSERLALRFNLVLVSGGAGALAGIAYTLLTGMQVPTVRSCIAALLVLAGIALGREAISLRLVAVGALIVLLFRPEALAGASFQLSFAAVTAIVTLHNLPAVRRLLAPRDDGFGMRLARGFVSLLLTGLAVEIALIPFALYHFHKAGLFSVLANLFAIPWTTFVVMPLEAAALLLDVVDLGAPLWAAAGWSIEQLLGVAHAVGGMKGAVASLPIIPRWAFAAMVFGGLWLCLWTSRIRLVGLVPFAAGAIGAAMAPTPDVLVTGDGRHLAIIDDQGVPVLLRERSGDFIRDLLSESAGHDGDLPPLADQGFARCSRDACIAEFRRGGRGWRLLAIRSGQKIDWVPLTRACAQADVVVADRWLPRGCTPKWLKLDRKALEATGGLAIYLGSEPRVASVAERVGELPWAGSVR